MSYIHPTPTMEEVEAWCKRKDDERAYVKAMEAARSLADRMWKASPEYKREQAEARRAKIKAAKIRVEMEARWAAEEAARKKAAIERALKRAAEREEREREVRVAAARRAELQAARDAMTERDHERERRSRIKWSEVIDNGAVVKAQIAWERRATALAMRQAGIGFRAIGERLGVSSARAQQLVAHAERWQSQPWRRSPAEAYMAATGVAAINPQKAVRLKLAVAALVSPPEVEADWIWMGLAA